jgi:hypothetical protein
MIVRFLAGLCLAMLLATAAAAQTPATGASASDRAAIHRVIEEQIAAFQRDDGGAAFGFASPTIQAMFGSPDNFMEMVRRGYTPVYRPRAVEFGELLDVDGTLIQLVDLIGPDGLPAVAAYEMQRQPDGVWRINGCQLLPGRARAV